MSVVVGYIPNEYGEAALTEALAEAQRRGTGLVVVNATRGDSLVDKRYVGERDRTELEERLSASPVDVELRQSIGADVAEEILAVAREVRAEALVIGVRHRSQVGKMLMGSVATRLLMEAPCPVVAVKP
ncbi:universal stress protein [uncultured Nocardioides sp.]|uniref:universal stress protein n=1 Tax=uncultured Nocardioides sp. TaxID=198441 RepID=UPI0025F309AE|nr:universal stress protein [uncultured Nocardioides sp.]